MSVAEILHRKGSAVSTIRSVDRVDVAVQRLRELRIGALVVMDRWGKFVGMISERHIVRGLERHGAKVLSSRVDEIMSHDVVTCAPEDRVDRAMALMTVHRVRHLPVVEHDRVIGIVSIGDLVKRQLETKEQEARVLRDMAAQTFPVNLGIFSDLVNELYVKTTNLDRQAHSKTRPVYERIPELKGIGKLLVTG